MDARLANSHPVIAKHALCQLPLPRAHDCLQHEHICCLGIAPERIRHGTSAVEGLQGNSAYATSCIHTLMSMGLAGDMEGKNLAIEAKAIKKDLQLSVKSKDALLKALKVHTKSTRILSQLSAPPVLADLTAPRDSQNVYLSSIKFRILQLKDPQA